MKRAEIMQDCPEEFEDRLKEIVDHFEQRFKDIKDKFDITSVHDLYQIEEALDIADEETQNLY